MKRHNRDSESNEKFEWTRKRENWQNDVDKAQYDDWRAEKTKRDKDFSMFFNKRRLFRVIYAKS